MKDIPFARSACVLLAVCLLAGLAGAEDIMQTMASVSNLFYGIAAGAAVLMLAYGALRWKTTEDPGEREAAKRGVLAVLIGLAVIVVASSALNVVYKKTDINVSVTVTKITTTVIRTTTTHRPTTTVLTTTTTSTTTTTILELTADGIVYCINTLKHASMITNADGGCGYCIAQRDNVFGKSPGGAAAYHKLNKYDPPQNIGPCYTTCTHFPCWCTATKGLATYGCHTFIELNHIYGCNLPCKAGYAYYDCNGNQINCP